MYIDNSKDDQDAGLSLNPEIVRLSQRLKTDSLSLMAAGLAHDFNNLLLVILGNADLLARDLEPGAPGRVLAEEILGAAGRATDLCTQLLAFAGKGRTRYQLMDLSAVTRAMVQMLKVALPRKITLRLDLDDGLPLLMADLNQVHQIIMNLVINAAEAIGPDQGVVTLATGKMGCEPGAFTYCALAGRPDGQEYAFIEVRDTGPGVSLEMMTRIFDPFFSTKLQGRGLGLASVLGAVRSHQGALCLKSEPGVETAFRICLPLDRVEAGTGVLSQPHDRAGTGKGLVLLVDDDSCLRVLGQRMIRRLGWEVVVAENGASALEIFAEQRESIGCVILDLVMPGMNGMEVLEKLSALDPDVQVIISSGYHEEEVARRFADRGLAGFLQKPYVMADLARVLDTVLRKPSPEGKPAPGS